MAIRWLGSGDHMGRLPEFATKQVNDLFPAQAPGSTHPRFPAWFPAAQTPRSPIQAVDATVIWRKTGDPEHVRRL